MPVPLQITPVGDAVEMVRLFGEVATRGPLEALLLLAGALLVVLPSAALAYLTLGALAEFVTPDASSPPPGPPGGSPR